MFILTWLNSRFQDDKGQSRIGNCVQKIIMQMRNGYDNKRRLVISSFLCMIVRNEQCIIHLVFSIVSLPLGFDLNRKMSKISDDRRALIKKQKLLSLSITSCVSTFFWCSISSAFAQVDLGSKFAMREMKRNESMELNETAMSFWSHALFWTGWSRSWYQSSLTIIIACQYSMSEDVCTDITSQALVQATFLDNCSSICTCDASKPTLSRASCQFS